MRFSERIPESMRRQFQAYEKTLFLSETILAMGAALSALAASLLLFFGIDRLFDTPKLARLLMLAGGLAPAAFLLVRWTKAWLIRRKGARELAAEIQAKHKELGDRLLGAVELAETGAGDADISEELLDAAIARIAERTEKMDFKKDVEFKKSSLAALATLALVAATLVLMTAFPNAFGNAIARWLNPLRSLARYTFTVIDEPSNDIVAPKNEPFDVKCVLNPKSKWIPGNVRYSLPGAGEGKAPVSENREATIKFQGLGERSKLTINAGDASVSKNVIPLRRPFPKNAVATITPPKYTARPPFSAKIKDGAVLAVEGSKLDIVVEMNRDLETAFLSSLKTGNKVQALKPKLNGATVRYPAVTVRGSVTLRLDCEDRYALRPKNPCDIRVEAVKDSEPFVEIPSLAPFSAMLRDEVLMVNVRAEDDYGIEKLEGTYKIQSLNGVKTPFSPRKRIKLNDGSRKTSKLDGAFAFSPEALGIPEKALVVIQGVAQDYFPGRNETFSAPKGIYVISQEEHAELLSRRLEDLMADLEDMARREKNSMAKNRSIEKLSDAKIAKQQTTDKIDSQRDLENAERREAKRLAEKMARLMKEALRNKKIPNKALAQWAKLLDQLNSMANNEMRQIPNKLSQASRSSSPKNRRGEMKKAIEQQKKLLEKLKKMISKMDDSLKNLALENFVNRLKKLAATERNISVNTTKMLQKIIGLPPDQIPQDVKNKFEAQKKEQKNVGEEGRAIRDEIEAFFARTRIKKYKDVSDDMKKTGLDAKLDKTKKAFDENKSAATIKHTAELAKNFTKWADMLAKQGNQKASGQQGQQGKIDMELLMSLLRIIQGEQNVRKKTRSLEKNKAGDPAYAENAKRLAAKQQELRTLLDKAKARAAKTCPKAGRLLQAVGGAMDDARKLLSVPDTGKQTVAAETAVIELLAGAAQKAGKSGGKGSGFGAMMALLRMMMGQSSGARPGGSMAGGFTNRRNMEFKTPDYNRDEGEKNVEGTSGTSRKLPPEYKSAIEAFFKKVKTGNK